LRKLCLVGSVRDRGVQALAAAPQFSRLIELDLSWNQCTPVAAQALIDSPHLGNLRTLRVAGSFPAWDEIRDALRERFGASGVVLQ
jgi:hypothetical protein